MIEKAIEMALKAHTGQKDLDGKPVILHPLAVGLAGKNDIQITVGILHDVVEDSNFTFEDLCKCGFSEEVIDSLKLLTHKKDVPYEEYVRNIFSSGNENAINVKLNDLKHNLKRGKAGGHEKQVMKHTKALAIAKEYGYE